MNRRIVSLIIAIVLGIVAIGLVHNYIRKKEAIIAQLAQTRQLGVVVVAITDIPKHARIQNNMVTQKQVPISSIQPGDLDSLDAVIGKVSAVNILRGEHISSTKLSFPAGDTSLALKIPEGKRAMTFQVDRITILEGMINPGDKVDLIGTFPFSQTVGSKVIKQTIQIPLYEYVLVLAVGDRLSPQAEKKMIPSTITLALAPDEAALLNYALGMGKITLFLRSPLERATALRREPMTVDKLWEKLLYIRRTEAPPKVEEPPTVEVYVGGEKSIVEQK